MPRDKSMEWGALMDEYAPLVDEQREAQAIVTRGFSTGRGPTMEQIHRLEAADRALVAFIKRKDAWLKEALKD